MYSGGFYPFPSSGEHWAYWSRYVYLNRFMPPPLPVCERLLEAVKGKDFFVLTTNVDHCFQRAGIDRERHFCTQGDFGLFQCSLPCHRNTYRNEAVIRAMLEAQGFRFDSDGSLLPPADGAPRMTVPDELIPRCPVCGREMSMNLRSDHTFVEDEAWHPAAGRYRQFLMRHRLSRLVFLEAGVGYNTPSIIKFPFQRMAAEWRDAVYICLNNGEADAPSALRERSLCLNGDIGEILARMQQPPSAAVR